MRINKKLSKQTFAKEYNKKRIAIVAEMAEYYLMNKLLSLLLILYITTTQAQNQKLIDSLEQTLPTVSVDTVRVEYLCALAFEYRNVNPDSALQLIDLAKKLAIKSGYQSGLALAYNHHGILFKNRRIFDSAIYCHQQALSIRTAINELKGMASSHNNLGVTYKSKGELSKSIYHYLQALRIREKNNDYFGIAIAWQNIARVYEDKNDRIKVINMLKKSLYNMQKAEDPFELARTHAQLGFAHYENNEYDEAVKHHLQADAIFEQLGDKMERCHTLCTLGNILIETGKDTQGLNYLLQAKQLATDADYEIGALTCDLSIGQYYIAIKQYDKGIQITKALLKTSEPYQLAEFNKDGYELLYRAYKGKGDFENALIYNEKFNAIRDTFIRKSNDKYIEELNTLYETEKKDAEIVRASLELKNISLELNKKRIQLFVLIAIVVVLFIFAKLYYSRYKLKQQAAFNAEKAQLQEQRNHAIIEAEEKERMRIARELHDGIGQQLSVLKLNLSAFEPSAESVSPELKARYETLLNLTDETVREVRQVSHQMIPNTLLRVGLAGAVRDFINTISMSGKLSVTLNIDGIDERLDATKEAVIYRVIQECVNNVIKHAQATEMVIQCIRHYNYLNIVIEDNGVGFDSKIARAATGIGLQNLTSRVAFMNGNIEFDSTPGKGTTVIIDIPLTVG